MVFPRRIVAVVPEVTFRDSLGLDREVLTLRGETGELNADREREEDGDDTPEVIDDGEDGRGTRVG